MIKTQRIPGFDFSKDSYADFITDFANAYSLENLGESSAEGVDLYGVGIGDFDTNKPVVMVTGAVHGNEWHSPYSILKFMDFVTQGHDGDESSIGPHREEFQRLRSSFNFYFIPIMNPYGFDDGMNDSARCNANGVDLNRNADIDWSAGPAQSGCTRGTSAFGEPESAIFRDKVLELNPFLYIDVHSWRTFDIDGAYWGDPREIYRAWIDDWEKSLRLVLDDKDFNIIRWNTSSNLQRWVNRETQSRYGIAPLTILIESVREHTPTQHSEYHLNAIFLLCLHALEWSRTMRLPVRSGN